MRSYAEELEKQELAKELEGEPEGNNSAFICLLCGSERNTDSPKFKEFLKNAGENGEGTNPIDRALMKVGWNAAITIAVDTALSMNNPEVAQELTKLRAI